MWAHCGVGDRSGGFGDRIAIGKVCVRFVGHRQGTGCERKGHERFCSSYVASIMVSKTTLKLSFLASLKEINLQLINGIA